MHFEKKKKTFRPSFFCFLVSIYIFSIVLDRLETQPGRDTTKFLPDTLDMNSQCKGVVCGGGGLLVP